MTTTCNGVAIVDAAKAASTGRRALPSDAALDAELKQLEPERYSREDS